ncbi:MAG: diaminopimelate epimerase [Planctomycetota bacterium]
MRVPFTKMEGAGNDYVFVDAIRDEFPLERANELARRWSDRHFGIGADGLILLRQSRVAAVAMAMWNADGSVGSMCGNGLRCLAVLARTHGHVDSDAFAVETAAGRRDVRLERDAAGTIVEVHTDLSPVTVELQPRSLTVLGHRIDYRRGDAGNPHAVVLLDVDPESFPVQAIGECMQQHADFPGGVNVEFVQVRSDGSLYQRTFERGSGETLACGTGAAVAALCALQLGLVKGPEVLVRLRGGRLRIARHERSLVIAGPASTVFRGEIDLRPEY